MNRNSELNIDEVYPLVIKAIERVGNNFKISKALILTESDLKCQLYAELSCIFRSNQYTFDSGILGTPLHTEIAFYNPNTSNYADMPVDIVILQPSNLSITKDVRIRMDKGRLTQKLPGKEYRALGDFILIELKFCKNKTGITDAFTASILQDIDKMKKIIDFNSDDIIKGVSVVFNKTDRYCEKFDSEILRANFKDVEVIYKSSDVIF